MRAILVAIIAFSFSAALEPVFALEADGTMSSWKHASVKERVELLGRILGKHTDDAASANILRCLNETADVSGHSDLKITEVARFCASAKGAGQPV